MHSYRVPQNCFFFEPMLMNFLEAGNFGLVQVRCPLDIRWVSLNPWPLSEEMCLVSSVWLPEGYYRDEHILWKGPMYIRLDILSSYVVIP